MTKITDFPAKGKIIEVRGNKVVFQPAGTTYQLHLGLADGDSPPTSLDRPIQGIIHIRARKLWTVSSGGNFIAPIFGPPRIIQGRVKWLNERLLVLQVGVPFIVEIPVSPDAIDLANGQIEAGSLVNVAAMPGAIMQLLSPVAAV